MQALACPTRTAEVAMHSLTEIALHLPGRLYLLRHAVPTFSCISESSLYTPGYYKKIDPEYITEGVIFLFGTYKRYDGLFTILCMSEGL